MNVADGRRSQNNRIVDVCNGTKKPTLCTSRYTRYISRHNSWAGLLRLAGAGAGAAIVVVALLLLLSSFAVLAVRLRWTAVISHSIILYLDIVRLRSWRNVLELDSSIFS